MGIAVLIWQSIIFLSIAFSGRHRGAVTTFWVVWTLLQVFALPLSIIQFMTIGISYSLFSKKGEDKDDGNKENNKDSNPLKIAADTGSNKNKVRDWTSVVSSSLNEDRWVPKGSAAQLVKQYPPPKLSSLGWRLASLRVSAEEVLSHLIDSHNKRHFEKKREERKPFFDSVERNPLTDEQVHACICMDDNVMVVAAAGSGKTSTMVAKAGYVLHEGLATPDQILLLAFNRATAVEVGERIAERLRDVSGVDRIRSKTFHGFGIEVIGLATGKKPSLAPWVDPASPGADIREIVDIIHALSDRHRDFKRDWDMFRTVYARDVKKWGQRQEPEAYADGKRGFMTAKGDVVKSMEERTIADWLFYNGVAYEYEQAYEHDTADQYHRQYFPDFYYPGIGLYHEHFALNAKGEAPADFKDYLQGVEWKRKIHLEMGTALFETTSYELLNGDAIKSLEEALIKKGIQPSFDPNRNAAGITPIPEADLARTFRVFQQHAKNNTLTTSDLQTALKEQSKDGFASRLRLYLSLYERIAAEWESRLRAGNFIDFEDMLIQAAEHIEAGRYKSPYSVILADEFQDSSRARIRLLKALTKNAPTQAHLCVVGDDWQGINRFAGSDISVMTEFESAFEYTTRLSLNTTFRCPQDLCDVSSSFIQANPAQIKKIVKTTNPLTKTPLQGFGLKSKESILAFIESQLALMHQLALSGKLTPSKGTHITVMILGRYKIDEPMALHEWKSRFADKLKINYLTIHSSKGLEAEYVFVLNVIQGVQGFPSQIQDDPALQLAMPAPDPYPFAEERRLFYVAMTRASKQVRLYTTLSQPSQFLVELIKKGHLSIEPIDGELLQPCPKCGSGILQSRQGSQGGFYGCSRFPACDYSRNSLSTDEPERNSKVASSRIRQLVKAGDQCPICRRGILQRRKGRNGEFLGCSQYPTCRATANMRSIAKE